MANHQHNSPHERQVHFSPPSNFVRGSFPRRTLLAPVNTCYSTTERVFLPMLKESWWDWIFCALPRWMTAKIGGTFPALYLLAILVALWRKNGFFLPGIYQIKLKSSSCKPLFAWIWEALSWANTILSAPKKPNKLCPTPRMVCEVMVYPAAGLDLTITLAYVFGSSFSPASPLSQNLIFHLDCCA